MKSASLLREPFLHFVLLGVLIFAADAALRYRTAEGGAGEIVVTAGRVENLAALFARTWQRAPTVTELRALIDGYVLEEALYREGIALGVDQGDSVIRRRVRQKMDFLVDDLVVAGEAPAADLEAWYAAHAKSYAEPPRYSFRQVYFNADRHGGALTSDASRALAELRRNDPGLDPSSVGDPSLFEFRYEDYVTDALTSVFGRTFTDNLAVLPPGEWSGPVESTYGLHLVFVETRTPARIPPLAEIRDEVERDWRFARGEDARNKFYADVVARYEVTIQWPDAADEVARAAGTEISGGSHR